MSTPLRSLRPAGLVLSALLGAACGVHAQDEVPAAKAWRSGTSYGGISVGQSRFGTNCGSVAGLTCRKTGTAVSLTAGDMFTDYLGAELSYVNFGHADRAGGTVSAQGIDLALVGRLPVNDQLSAFAKVGGTYGITHVDASTDAGLVSGRESGFGLGYGAGLTYNISRTFNASLEWQRHDMHFAGQGTSGVSMVTAGIGFRF